MSLFLDIMIIPLGLLVMIGIIAIMGKRFSKKLSINQKTGWLIAHVIFVIVYFSGMFGTLLLSVSTMYTTDGGLIYGAHLFIQYFDWFLIIPGAFGSLLTGSWLAARTNWGLTKFYWVIAKWVGNIAAITFGAHYMRIRIHDNFHGIFSSLVHPLQNPAYLENRQLLFTGIAISFAILIFLLLISYLKPWRKRKNAVSMSEALKAGTQ